ncbi:B12-binding domain-containing radical SAM protein [Caldibacillus lycopersici]|uniref:B12-binding domain-containing radical SAM protein n=1 Tax=Perspicuibacillus lycopersici TaxID=1325689 RepID=A0AAE3IT76_9BACI|nr:B12-binding domain-containing radical SAM protein [Perspicuibacillus lycopersici]MCU9612299.1 B12-binding domain-containing radical SAM protein [Perspicuibacillus lycopersici]
MKTIVTTLNAKYIHMNLAIRYLKAYAEPQFPVELVEYTIKDPVMNIVADLYKRKPNILGFSCYIWNIEETIKVIQLLKKANPNVKIILGGPEVSYDVGYWLERIPEVDVIAMGEGEATFKQILHAFKSGNSLKEVQGIAYLQEGRLQINPAREKLDLRNLPTPFRFDQDKKDLAKRVIYIETSRGCPFNCQFCLSSIEVGVRYFDREKIKEEIRYLMKNGARTIKFVDRTFNISRKYAMDMFQFLIDEHVPGTVFQFEITGDIMRPEVIEFLNTNAPKGLFRFEIGVQSTNDYTNELVKRRQNFTKLTRTVKMVKDGGKIDQHLDLIAGLPEEDYQSFKKTFNDVFHLRPEELQLGFLKMLRGTGLRIQAKQWDYTYMEQSPYEIIRNNVLSFDDVIKIKQVEDILEKYWNAHRMDTTIEYLVTNIFESPYDFFQSFGTFWDNAGWSKIGHQLEDLFTRLHQFLQELSINEFDSVSGLMIYDYLIRQKYKPRKIWWINNVKKAVSGAIYHQIQSHSNIPEQIKGLSERDWYKDTIIVKYPFNLAHYLQTGDMIKKEGYVLFYYDRKGNCSCYPLEENINEATA